MTLKVLVALAFLLIFGTLIIWWKFIHRSSASDKHMGLRAHEIDASIGERAHGTEATQKRKTNVAIGEPDYVTEAKKLKVYRMVHCGAPFCQGPRPGSTDSCTAECPEFAENTMAYRAFEDQPTFTEDRSEADLIFIPGDFAASFYSETVPSWEGMELMDWIENIAVKRLCTWFDERAHYFPDDGIPYYFVFAYVFYGIDISCIPGHIYIIAYENIGVTGPPKDDDFANGCGNRCIVIPYATAHSIGADTKKPYPYNWLARKQHSYHVEEFFPFMLEKRFAVSFVGSLDRTPTLARFRLPFINDAKSHFGPRFGSHDEKGFGSSQTLYLELYRKSHCCLILRGDANTRLALFSAVMEGCVPVIYEQTAKILGMTLGGIVEPEKTFIVLPDLIWLNRNKEASQVGIDILASKCTAHGVESYFPHLKKLSRAISYDSSVNGMSDAVALSLLGVQRKGRPMVPQEKLIFMPDLDPKFNVDMLHHPGIDIANGDGFISTRDNMAFESPFGLAKHVLDLGLGEELVGDEWKSMLADNIGFDFAVHLTSQYSLELLVHSKMMTHPRRTASLDQASVVVVPVYLFCAQWAKVPRVCSQTDGAEMLDMAYEKVLNLNVPKDVPVIWIFGDVLWGQKGYFLQRSQVQFSANWYILALEGDQNIGYSNKLSLDHVIQMPYPTILHAKLPMGLGNEHGRISADEDGAVGLYKARRHLICYYGRSRWPVTLDRKNIHEQDLMIMQVDLVGWKTIRSAAAYQQIFSLYSDCDFVLCPYGDMGTRRSFYDAMISGAIPLVFEDNAPQYGNIFGGMHLDFDIHDMFVTLPKLGDTDFWKEAVKFLRESILPKKMSEIRNSIKTHLRKMQYSLTHDPGDALETAISVVLTRHMQ